MQHSKKTNEDVNEDVDLGGKHYENISNMYFSPPDGMTMLASILFTGGEFFLQKTFTL